MEPLTEKEVAEIRRQIIREHHQAMGKKGGDTTLEKHGKEYFKKISGMRKKKPLV